MRQGKRDSLILCLFGVLPVVWLGLAMAPGPPRRHTPKITPIKKLKKPTPHKKNFFVN